MSDINSNDSAPTTDADVVQDPSSAAPAPSPEPSSVDAPAPQEAAAGSDDAGEHGDADDHGDDEHGDDDHDDGSESGEAAEGGEGTEGGGKRKRRRRKKKKPEVDNSQKSAHVPFLRYFDGRGTKTHAFAAGEVVAGRVAKLTNTTIFVDLFGKGLAVVDVYEPREVPALPEPVVAPEASAAAEAGEAAAAEGTEGEAPVAAEASEAGEHADEHHEEHEHDEHHDEHEHDEHDDEDHEGHTSAGFLEAMEAAGPPPELPAMGGIVRGRISSVSESGHIVLVNRIIDRGATKARIAAARDAKLRVRGMVYGFNRGGFDVLVDGVRAFCPARAMSLTEITDPESYVGQKLDFSLPPLKGGGRSIIVSRRGILERESRKAARERMKQLKVGERLPGTVLHVRDFGVIVDLGGGLDGLVHQSEVSWVRGARMSDCVKPGDEVKVEVLRVQPASRKDRYGKISLSIRAALPDPWDQAKDILKEGHFQSARVVRTTDFGAFVELRPGIEGLLHITELGKDLKHANQVLKEDEVIDVIVERVDKKARRVGLSRLSASDKAAMESGDYDPALVRNLRMGNHVKVVVERIEHHGMFVQVKGVVGKRGRGYLSNRDMPERVEGTAYKKMAVGMEIEVKITGTDRDGQLRCSVKHREFDDERKAVQEYRKEAGRQGLGTFADLLRAKLDGSGGDKS
jgi:small subunit ribosomal protein S1